ncbi:MAG: DMT family transporter [Pseudomonadota bacterium]
MRNIIPSHRHAILLMIVTTLLWSSAGVLTRHLTAGQGFIVTFWRSLFAAFFVAILLGWRQPKTLFPSIYKAGKIGLFSGLMWCCMFCCFMVALSMTTVANTLIVSSLSPLLTAIFAWVFLKEPIVFRTAIAIAAATAGMVIMFSTGINIDHTHLLGMLIALGVPIAASLNFIMLKKAGQHLDLIPSILLGCFFSIIAMLPLAWPVATSQHDLPILIALGFFQLGLPCMLLVVASKSLSASEISLLTLLEVVLGPIWVWLGVGEIPAKETLWGGAIILGALIFNELVAIRVKYKILKA